MCTSQCGTVCRIFTHCIFFLKVHIKWVFSSFLGFLKFGPHLRVGIVWNSGFFDLERRSTCAGGKTVRRLFNFLFYMNSQVGNANNRNSLCIKNINKMAARIFWKWPKWKKLKTVFWGKVRFFHAHPT